MFKNILSGLSFFSALAFSAPSQQIVLSSDVHKGQEIPITLLDDFYDLSKIVDITNCLQTPEGISYPFECNSFCREFPELKVLKQWNTADDLGDSYGYIAISHEKGKERIIIAFAGAYSLTDAIIDLSATPEDYTPLFSGADSALDSCPGCKVHGDAYREWLKTEELIGPTVRDLVAQHNSVEEGLYQLALVGYKLGGAVAVLAAVEFEARGWNPQVTTFSQPKVGNEAFADYLSGKFTPLTYRRVTHVSDPVPLFPSNRQGFSHYEHEYFISKEFAPYTALDVQICSGHANPTCPLRMDSNDMLDLDWESSDYFHHTDTCVREPTSFFSFSSSIFMIEFENLGLQKRSHDGIEFYTALDTIKEGPGNGDGQSKFEETRSLGGKNNKQKRDTSVKPDTKLVKAIPDSKFAKTFEMVEPAPKRVPPEFEDEEIYHAMRGFDKAQGMWVKPNRPPITEMKKRATVIDPDVNFVKAVPDSKFKKTFAMVEEPKPEEIYVPEYEDEEIYNSMSGFGTAQAMWIKPKEANEKKKVVDVDSEIKTTPSLTIRTFEGEDGVPGLEINESHALGVSAFDDVSETQDALELDGLEKRGFDRALKFFHAPKEVLNAQLAANDEAAAYEAYLKTQQNPNGSPEAVPGEHNPNQDYIKKGGSVLMMNGRPLEVDGRPVSRNKIQKRSNGYGPGLGFNRGNGLRHGGLKRGGGDKVTEMSSSSPPTTQSNSVAGTIANAVPSSFEEETVNVQQGSNFVLMNGRPAFGNFARKSLSVEPQRRPYISEYEHEQRFRIPEERRFEPEQNLRAQEEYFPDLEHYSRASENPLRQPDNIRPPEEHLYQTEENFRQSQEHFYRPEKQLEYSFTKKSSFALGEHPHQTEHFAIPEQIFYQPEDNFFPAEDESTIPNHYYNAREDRFYTPQENFFLEGGFYMLGEQEAFCTPERQHFTNEDLLEFPPETVGFPAEEQFGVPEEHFYIPGQRAYLPENEHV